jgi:hypothetical protein
VPVEWLRELEVLREVVLAEIRRFEELLQQNDVRTLARRRAHQLLGARDVGGALPRAGHLGGRDGDCAHDRSIQVVLSSTY